MACFRLLIHTAWNCLALLILISLPGLPQAQPSGAQGEHFVYKVIQNDTLIDLAQRYTHNESNWRTLQRLNQVSEPAKMPIGRVIRIPFSLIPEQAAQATITHIRGQTTLNGKQAQAGQAVKEGDVLETAPNSFLTLTLPDGSESALPGATTLAVERLRTFTGTGLIDAIIKLESGSLEASVAPEGQGTGRYEIRTPVSITGVRGTHLRVRLDQHDHTYTEVLDGSAQLGRQTTDGPQLMANQGTVVDAVGTIQPPRPLLPAPVLTGAPDGGQLHFEPVANAAGYQVRTAADPLGIRPFSVQTVKQSPVSVSVPSATTWYVLVRAIDDQGLMGPDAMLELEGGNVLLSGYGLVVSDGSGQPVQLTAY